jgi:hypothetical protein
LLGLIGPKAEAEEIKRRLSAFLRDDLKLELSPEKTLITHARDGVARFLSYEITIVHNDKLVTNGQRSANGTIRLQVPRSVIKAKSAPYLRRSKPGRRTSLINADDYTIVSIYGAQYRGIVQYYLLANDVWRLNRLRWVMETSMLKTLAAKHRSTVSKMAAKHKAKIETPYGRRMCFEATVEREGKKALVARFGGIPLKRQKTAVLTDRLSTGPIYPHKELIRRLRRGRCELCNGTDKIIVHHVRKLADLHRLGQPQPRWAQVMAKRRRKSLVVCEDCHDQIHAGQPTATNT